MAPEKMKLQEIRSDSAALFYRKYNAIYLKGREPVLTHMNLELNLYLIFSQEKFLKFFDYRTMLCSVFLFQLSGF